MIIRRSISAAVFEGLADCLLDILDGLPVEFVAHLQLQQAPPLRVVFQQWLVLRVLLS